MYIILSALTCIGFTNTTLFGEAPFFESSPVWMVLFCVGTAFLYEKTFLFLKKRSFFVSLIFGLMVGTMIILGKYYAEELTIHMNFFWLCLFLGSVSVFTASIINLFWHSIEKGSESKRNQTFIERKFKFRIFFYGWKGYFILFVAIGLCFVPAFLAVYPGIYSYDASVQILQFFGDKPLSTHHPILHTLFLCGSLKAGELLFHSYQAGMAIHSVLQCVCMSGIISYVIWNMNKNNRPLWLILFTFVFLVLNPYMQIFVFITTKDVLFSGIFLLVFLFSWDMVCKPEEFLKSPYEVLRYFIAVFLMCLFRNQGIHVFLLFAAAYFIFLLLCRKKWLNWTIFVTILTGSYLIISGPFLSFLGVERGDAREALSVPMQQLARVYHEAPEQLDETEQAYLTKLIPEQYLKQYISVNADPVKSGFQTEVMKEDPDKFLKTWLSIGKKVPGIYADSFFMGNWGYWYPLQTQYWIQYILFDGAFLESPYNVLNIHRNSHFPSYETYLRDISVVPKYEEIPLVSILLNQAFPFWLILAVAATAVAYKKYQILFPLLLLFGYWGTLLLGPVTSVRYALPLMISVPSLLEMLIRTARQNE